MSTILEADETGTLHLPAAMLPHPGPHRRYRVASESGQVVVDEALPEENGKPDLASVRALLGRVKMPDGAAYEQELRSEWDSRG